MCVCVQLCVWVKIDCDMCAQCAHSECHWNQSEGQNTQLSLERKKIGFYCCLFKYNIKGQIVKKKHINSTHTDKPTIGTQKTKKHSLWTSNKMDISNDVCRKCEFTQFFLCSFYLIEHSKNRKRKRERARAHARDTHIDVKQLPTNYFLCEIIFHLNKISSNGNFDEQSSKYTLDCPLMSFNHQFVLRSAILFCIDKIKFNAKKFQINLPIDLTSPQNFLCTFFNEVVFKKTKLRRFEVSK